jgi:Flp pilus assembly protein TadG
MRQGFANEASLQVPALSAVETQVMSKLPRNRIGKRLFSSRLVRLVRRFARQEGGATAIEFGMVAMPFLALLFAILETALVFFAGQTLESAVQDSARLILTGQAQNAGYSAADFKLQVCNRTASLFDCTNNMYVDVKSYSTFGAISSNPPVTNNQFDPTKTGYSLGGPGCIQVVSLYYKWPIYVSLLSDNLSNLSGNYRLLSASAVFKNEPYATKGGCP